MTEFFETLPSVYNLYALWGKILMKIKLEVTKLVCDINVINILTT